jgi:hypothetical protein
LGTPVDIFYSIVLEDSCCFGRFLPFGQVPAVLESSPANQIMRPCRRLGPSQGVRGGEPVGRHWAERFVTRSDELEMALN